MALHERVVHLDDLILRRTLMALLGQVNGPLLEELAAVVSPVLGWSPKDAAAEVERTINYWKGSRGDGGRGIEIGP